VQLSAVSDTILFDVSRPTLDISKQNIQSLLCKTKLCVTVHKYQNLKNNIIAESARRGTTTTTKVSRARAAGRSRSPRGLRRPRPQHRQHQAIAGGCARAAVDLLASRAAVLDHVEHVVDGIICDELQSTATAGAAHILHGIAWHWHDRSFGRCRVARALNMRRQLRRNQRRLGTRRRCRPRHEHGEQIHTSKMFMHDDAAMRTASAPDEAMQRQWLVKTGCSGCSTTIRRSERATHAEQ
jgi:hypothetical protein